MLNRRLLILSKKEGAPFTRAEAGVEEAFGAFRESSIEVRCRADQWGAALGVAEQELRRALELGFRPDELKEEVADYRNELEEGREDRLDAALRGACGRDSRTASSTGTCSRARPTTSHFWGPCWTG